MSKEAELEAEVEKLLRGEGLNYIKEPVVGETRPDFVVTTEQGDQIVVEVKAWAPGPESLGRAIHQAQRYLELSNAAGALVVTAAGLAFSSASGGVVPISGLVDVLSELTKALARRRKSPRSAPARASPKNKVFASMPFSGRYDDTFLVGIQPSALALNAAADRVDHAGKSGDVVRQIKDMIKASRAVVADLSESRANVCHEVGYAEALGKPVVQICSTPVADLPFNLRNNQTIAYSVGQVSRLKAKLEKELAKVL